MPMVLPFGLLMTIPFSVPIAPTPIRLVVQGQIVAMSLMAALHGMHYIAGTEPLDQGRWRPATPDFQARPHILTGHIAGGGNKQTLARRYCHRRFDPEIEAFVFPGAIFFCRLVTSAPYCRIQLIRPRNSAFTLNCADRNI
jgi:hypothetical protein